MMGAGSQFERQNACESRLLLDVTEYSQEWGGTTVNAGVVAGRHTPG